MPFNKDIILTHSGNILPFKKLVDYGYNIHHYPMINIKSNENIKPFLLENNDYYIFTSKNAVDAFFNYPFIQVQYDKKIKAICSGIKTAHKLREYGISPIFISKSSYAEDLAYELLESKIINDSNVMLVLGNLASSDLENTIKDFTTVNRINVYSTFLNQSQDKGIVELINNGDSIVVFASPSSFRAFYNLYDLNKIDIISIGNTTTRYIQKLGFNTAVTSKSQSLEGVVSEIIEKYKINYIKI